MSSLLEGDIAEQIGDALSDIFLDATLTRDLPGVATDAFDPPAPTQVTYPCKALDMDYSVGLLAQAFVAATDINVMILATTLAVQPKPMDRITVRGNTVSIVPASTAGMQAVTSDPARATWSCRCAK